MAVKMISVSNENKVREYSCLSTDAKSTYPTDCEKGSKMTVLDPVSGKQVGELLYDGAVFKDSDIVTTLEDTLVITDIVGVADTFTIDVNGKMVKRVFMKVDSANAVTVEALNVPRDCKIELILDYVTALSMTFFGDFAPVLVDGTKYQFVLTTIDGGATYFVK